MSEYRFVEQPFLDQLAALGWEVIDLGEGIPGDPASSHRDDFREVVLKNIFKTSVSRLNVTDKGQQWLNEKQLDDLFDEVELQPTESTQELSGNSKDDTGNDQNSAAS